MSTPTTIKVRPGAVTPIVKAVIASPGPQGPAGPQGAQGPVGADGPLGPAGPQGTQGPVGAQGPAGLNGADGTSVSLKGAVETLADLPTTNLVTGDLFIVLQEDGNGYLWNGTEYIDVGPIRGPEGQQGPVGPQGVQGGLGQVGATGLSAFEEAVAQGFVGTELDFLASLVGPTGPAGPQGQAGADGGTNIIIDETPQLGGDLDVNAKKITSAADGDVVIDPNGTGKTLIDSNVEVSGQTKTTTLNIDDKSLYVAGAVTDIGTVTPTLIYTTNRKSAKIAVKLNRNNAEIQMSEFLLVTDGTTPKGTEYAVLFTGNDSLGTFTLVQNGNALEFFCLASNANTNATFTAFDLS